MLTAMQGIKMPQCCFHQTFLPHRSARGMLAVDCFLNCNCLEYSPHISYVKVDFILGWKVPGAYCFIFIRTFVVLFLLH